MIRPIASRLGAVASALLPMLVSIACERTPATARPCSEVAARREEIADDTARRYQVERIPPEGLELESDFSQFPHERRMDDVAELEQAPQVYLFDTENALNWIALATRDQRRAGIDELRERAAALDSRFAGSLSFATMIDLYRG